MTVLSVWRNARRVGVLDTTVSGDARFTYGSDVVADPRPESAIALRCPIRAKPYIGLDAAAVFENLLPEGALRDVLGQATKHDPSDTVGLLGVVGGECVGALQFWPDGITPPEHPEYDDVSAALFTSFRGTARPRRSSSSVQARISRTSSKLKWSGCV